jgi:hypothetical protein
VWPVRSSKRPPDGAGKRPAAPRSGLQGWLRRWGPPLGTAGGLALVLTLVLVGWRWLRADASAPAPAVSVASAPTPAGRPFFGNVDGGGLPPLEDRARRRRALAEHLALVDHTYCSYRAGSQYPAGSRPMAEHADQNAPNSPVTEINPMRLEDGGSGQMSDARVQLQTSQSRVYMAAGEAVAFSLRAVDAEGRVLPLVVTRALARGITYGATRPAPQVTLPFADDGNGADPVAGDGAFAGVLAPAQTGLAGFDGTIRTEVRYNVGGKSGAVLFDVIYTPELPALWSGPVREAVENGSLAFILKLDVRMPGRYVISGRVDDAQGKPFALLTFNDILGPGPNDVRLTVFGKLMRDQQAVLPLTLRDVDGYLLKENADPDRALLPRLEGKVFTGRAHPLSGFSDAEWQSEERTRYLTELARDVAEARKTLVDFDPAQPLPPSECAQNAQTRPPK